MISVNSLRKILKNDFLKLFILVLLVSLVLIRPMKFLKKNLFVFNALYGKQELIWHPLDLYAERFKFLKKYIPDYTVVGYIAEKNKNKKDAYNQYLYMRYFLLPIIVEKQDKDTKFVIGNFQRHPDRRGLQNLREKRGLKPILFSSNGVVLFKREK